jgi:hypothetical protein
MGTQEELLKVALELTQCGILVGQCMVVTDWVFFTELRLAKGFSERFDKDLTRVDGVVSGWLRNE